ncbi:Isochorismatase-like protein [Trichoderma camerunense]
MLIRRPFHLLTHRPVILPSSNLARLRPLSLSHSLSSPLKMATPTELRFKNPAIFVCDMQDKFRNVIYEFDSIVTTTVKLLTYAQSLSIPVHTTTQTSAKLGATVPAIADLLPSPPHDKTKFSMLVPSVAAQLEPQSRIALVGIESHICITQTALDLRDAGHFPYVIADGVSSCNRGEVGIALDRLRSEPGITVTTSESWMYECLGDASHPLFKSLITVVKNKSSENSKVLNVLPPAPKI